MKQISGDLLHQRPGFQAAFGNATKRGVDATDFEKLATQFPDMIKPHDREFIVRKARASAFFGTHLITYWCARTSTVYW